MLQLFFMSLIMIWCAGSLGTPFLAGSYVGWLGRNFHQIQTAGSTKKPELIDMKTAQVIFPSTEFETNVLDSKNYHLMVGLGPLAILSSGYYAGISTYNLIAGK